jgi:DNA-binding transcriptional LysR family regulator
MHLTRLRYFVVTAEEQSVVRAARRLRVAQPALSRQLAALEQEVGTPLLERHARGVRLLPAGEALLAHARRMLAEAEIGVSAALTAAHGSSVAELRLAMPDVPVRAAWVGRALEMLGTSRPDVRVRYDTTLWLEHETAVQGGRIDVGFAVAMNAGDFSDDVESDRICDEPASVAVLPATHPLAHRSSLRLSDLRDVPLLAPPRDKAPKLHEQSIAVVRSAGYEPRIAPASTSFAATLQLVAGGAGWVIALNCVREGLPSEVRAVPIADASLVLGFYLLRKRGHGNAVADLFAECLHRVAGAKGAATASSGNAT